MTQRSKIFGWIAAALSLAWFVVHTFVGGAQVEIPLRASDLPAGVMAPAVMVWHMTTGVLLLSAVLFAVATRKADTGMMLSASTIAAVLAVAGLASVPVTGVSLALLPQGLLFVPVAAAGFLAWRGMRTS